MNYKRNFSLALLVIGSCGVASAQTRSVGAHAFILDDGSGNTITIQTPGSGWSGNIPFQLPIPPTGNPLAGFVHVGTALNQILVWNPVDGPQGAWDASTIGALGGLTGSGTVGFLPLWTGSSTQGNSAIQDDGTTVSVTNGEALLMSGTMATTPAGGAGTRMEWIPVHGAFRAGAVDDTQWDDAYIGTNSVAMGYNTISSNNNSVAMGYGSMATGNNSTAFGSGTLADGDAATTFGWTSHASGQASLATGFGTLASGTLATAMGYLDTASGFASTSLGQKTVASNNNSTAMGYGSNASGNNSTAMGSGAVASGDASTAIGWGVTASNLTSIAMGRATTSSGSSSLATGYNTTASGDNTTAMGSYASTNGNVGSFVYGDASTTSVLMVNNPNEFDVRAAGGVNFYTKSDLTTGVSFPANGGIIIGMGTNATALTSTASSARTISFPDNSGTVALTTDIPSISGTSNTIAKFGASNSLGNSALTDDGTTLSYSGTGGLNLGANPINSTGDITFDNSGNRTISIPAASGGGNSLTISTGDAQGVQDNAGGITIQPGSVPDGFNLNPYGNGGSIYLVSGINHYSSGVGGYAGNIAITASQAAFGTSNNGYITMTAGGAERLRIDGTGTVTINTGGSANTTIGNASGTADITRLSVGGGATMLKDLTATASLTFGATAAQSSSDQTIAVSGAALGDPVFLGVPNAAVLTNSSYSAWVSAAGTVTVRFNNYSSGSLTPGGPNTFRVVVMQF